ncbi:MAG: GtrA family protein [Bacteroidales bacterium]|nr:GtrA family protein [Bacteroidales bacterium]
MDYYFELIIKFFKFSIVGFSGLIIDFSLTYLFRNILKVNQYIANAIGFIVASSSNYILNRIWTFTSHNPQILGEYAKFLLVAIIGLLINTLVLYFLVSKLNWKFYFSKLFAIGAATLWNFFINLIFTFK